MLRYRPPPIDRAAILYKKFTKRAGVEPITGETPARYAVRAATESPIPAETFDLVTSTYLDARYGPADPMALQRLESTVARL